MAVSIGHLLLHELRRSSLAASSQDSDKRPEAGTGAEDVRVGRSASSSSPEVNREALHGRSRGGGGGARGGGAAGRRSRRSRSCSLEVSTFGAGRSGPWMLRARMPRGWDPAPGARGGGSGGTHLR